MSFRYKAIALIMIFLSASIYAEPRTPSSPASQLLKHRTELRLSRTQVRRLYDLDRDFIAIVRPVHGKMLELRRAERLLRMSDREYTGVTRERRAGHHAEMRRDAAQIDQARDSCREAAFRLLTPSQRTLANELTARLPRR